MPRFTEELTVVNRLSARVHEWELCESMSYRLKDVDESEVVNVPAGFRTDFASVPRPFWFWISPWGRHGRAAIVHDYLYQLGSIVDPTSGITRHPSKNESDRIFRQAMGVLDRAILARRPLWRRFPTLLPVRLTVAALRRWLMWGAVAVFGHWAYREARTGSIEALLEQNVHRAAARGGRAMSSVTGEALEVEGS